MLNKFCKILTIIICMVVFALGCERSGDKQSASNHEIGIIDKTALMKMSAFRKAGERSSAAIDSLRKSYDEKMKTLTTDAQRQELSQMYLQEENSVRSKEFTPVREKMEAAIAVVASEKGIKVVLDKSVVVTGAQDLTESVKERFQQEGDISLPANAIGEDSIVGYFDQDVVRNLKMFRDLDRVMYEDMTKARKDMDEKFKTFDDAQKRALFEKYNKELAEKRQALSLPLLGKVTSTVETVAKQENLKLVLDKQYVMYGGRNVTDKVVDRLKDEEGPKVPESAK